MATPISPRDIGFLLSCGALLPVGAFLAALPIQVAKRKLVNILGFIIGLLAISGVTAVLLQYG